jgi:hypothetical protein
MDWGVKRFYTLSDRINEGGLAPLKEKTQATALRSADGVGKQRRSM